MRSGDSISDEERVLRRMGVSLTWIPRPAGAPAGERVEHEPEAVPRVLQAEDGRALVAAGGASLAGGPLSGAGGLQDCLACGHPELFTQRDFPRALGITIVVLAAVLAPFTSYISLGVAALLDFALFHTSPKMVVCYVCDAQHRGFPERPRHPVFDREIDERLRYGAKAVMGKPMRPGGTADAPEPEH